MLLQNNKHCGIPIIQNTSKFVTMNLCDELRHLGKLLACIQRFILILLHCLASLTEFGTFKFSSYSNMWKEQEVTLLEIHFKISNECRATKDVKEAVYLFEKWLYLIHFEVVKMLTLLMAPR